MLVVDPLHELDVGIWKEIFLHLIRILNATKPENVATLDHRYASSAAINKILTLLH